MSSSPASFRRGLSKDFLSALDALTERSGWWRDILSRHDLVIAIRNEYLNVYYRGASIFRIERHGSTLVPITHAKYLVRRVQGEIVLGADGHFALDPITALWSSYAGPQTLTEMMAAAAAIAGPEKIGLHPLLLASPNVIDVEITLGAAVPDAAETSPDGAVVAAEVDATSEDSEPAPGQVSAPTSPSRLDRLDVATLEERDGAVFVVFHEAKHFANKELRASPERTPPVAEQIARYRRTLVSQADAISEAYREVCQALVAIDAMRCRVVGEASKLHPLIARVASDNLTPTVDPEARLVVFGFDADQRDGTRWGEHRARLTRPIPDGYGLQLHALGSTKGRRQPAFGPA